MMHYQEVTTRLSTLLLGCATLVAAAGAAGCNAFNLKTPEGFVSIERLRKRTQYKAVAPDGTVISISSFKHRDKGSLNYWTEIVKRQMTLRRGYKLEETRSVKTDAGLEGKQLVFTTKSGQTPYRYTATLFITSSYIHVIETGARKKHYKEHKAAFDAAIASFRPR